MEKENFYHELHLFSNGLETVKVMLLPKNSVINLPVPKGGREVFVVDGVMTSALGEHNADSWARLTEEEVSGEVFEVKTGDEDVYLWSKEGHLKSPEIDIDLAKKQELELIAAAAEAGNKGN